MLYCFGFNLIYSYNWLSSAIEKLRIRLADGAIKSVANRVLAIAIPFLPLGIRNRYNKHFSKMETSTDDVVIAENHSKSPSREIQVSDNHPTRFSHLGSTLISSLKWCPTSEAELADAEAQLLKVIERPFKSYMVDIGEGWGEKSIKINTLEMLTNAEIESEKKEENQKVPLILIHGFGAGICTWILNLDTLASTIDRKIYAFDLFGFGRSTRAQFDFTGDVEGQFVDSIEKWRQKQGINKFILLGHSFGGYLSASYALKHPERVSHIILADPWGVQDRQNAPNRGIYKFPFWVRAVTSVFQHFNPLAVLRVTGPYGPTIIQRFRGDLREKFRPKLNEDCEKFLEYIYHCNAQSATGESAFKALTLPYGWPKNPLIHRLMDLDDSITLTFIYGSRSWIEKAPGELLRDCMRPNRVTVNVIQGSGHHVYADKYTEFNELVKEACKKVGH